MMWMVHSLKAGPILFGLIDRVLWEFSLPIGATIAAVALGCWVIYRVKLWREELAQETPLSPQELIDHYQKMMDDGLLDPQEFAQIKANMAKQPASAPTSDGHPPAPANRPPDTSFFEK
jgi:hypothetical protein